jgi:hypothetical protein
MTVQHAAADHALQTAKATDAASCNDEIRRRKKITERGRTGRGS